MKKTLVSLVLSALLLTACGGGGSSDPSGNNSKVSTVPVGMQIAAFGDSLTFGSPAGDYPSELSNLLGRPVFNYGVPGQTSAQIVARQGAVPALLTFAAPQLIVGINPVISYSTTPVTTFSPAPIAGTIDGIAGTLSQVAPSKPDMAFTASSAGPVSANAPFIPSNSDAARDQIQVLWIGRNDLYSNPGDIVAGITASATAAVSFVRSGRVIVLAVPNGDLEYEYQGQPGYQTILDVNHSLAAIRGAIYIDVRSLLVAAYDPTNPQDVIDHGHDITPSSLRLPGDPVHLNGNGYMIVAKAIQSAVVQAGW